MTAPPSGQRIAVYGRPPPELAPIPPDAAQVSPLIPGAGRLEDIPDRALEAMTLLAPQGVLERRFVLAHALRALSEGGTLLALAPKEKGGSRLGKELAAFGCAVEESAKRHHRICRVARPISVIGVAEAVQAGAPRIPESLGLWSQPGIFSWDRPDPGSLALTAVLPPLRGLGADFGCGVGLLARAVLEGPDVAKLVLVDVDRRAVDAARRNVVDPRTEFLWRDLRAESATEDLRGLDFVVMNPPFHDGGFEDRALGEIFLRRAAAALKPSGVCWLVANRHLPYEATLRSLFPRATMVEHGDRYKIFEARR